MKQLTIFFTALTIFAANQNIQVGSVDEPILVNLTNFSDSEMQIDMNIGEFEMMPVLIDGEEFVVVKLDDESNILSAGVPDIPDVRRSVIIPDDARMSVRVISSEYTDFDNIQIAPSKGVVYRNVDWDSVPREFGEVYEQDAFYPGNLVELNSPYILRDFRGQVVKINPFQYNPVTKVLRVYTNIEVEVFADGSGEVNTFNRTKSIEKIDSEFHEIYQRQFLNYSIDRYTPVSDQGNMLVVYYDSFESAIQPLVEWKNMKGVPTEMIPISQFGGSNGNTLKSNIANYYNTNGLTFVLLVGDAAQIPTVSTGAGVSDISYGYISGSDSYPELFVGRFSAENIGQVNTQVTRTIEYERDYSSGSWFHKGMGVASDQGPGDDNEYDNVHVDNIREDLLAYTYTEVDQIYDPSASASQVTTGLNNGRSIINYTGHGSSTSWGSSGFSNSNINSLTNDNMLPFIWSVACVNGEFMNTTCFGEAWLRATHNGEPTGAIGAFMATINQSWSPPMDGQDEMNDILVESYANNIKRTYGGLSFNGCMHMNDEYGSGGDDMTDTWTIFGDPSVVVRTDTPTSMNVQAPPTLMVGTSVYQMSVPGVSGALAAISKNGILLGSSFSDASGNITIEFGEPITEPGEYILVVTAYNKITHSSTVVASTDPGPYLVFNSLDINGSAEAGQTFDLFVTVSNIGDEPATNVNGILSTNDPLITILNANANYGTIADGALATNATAFSVQVSSNTQDGHIAQFGLNLGDWDVNFSIACQAIPELDVSADVLVGYAQLGGTDEAIFTITNVGTGDLNYSITAEETSRTRTTDVAIVCDGGSWQEEVSWTIQNSDGTVVASGGAPFSSNVSLGNGVYTVYAEDSYGDGWNGNVMTITDLSDNTVYLEYTLESGSSGTTNFEVDAVTWFELSSEGGSASAGESDEITVLFQALDIPEGTYTGVLTIASNGGTDTVDLIFEAGTVDPCADWQLGDVNNDGIVNVLDIVGVVNHIVGLNTLVDCAEWAADFNEDSVVNVLDIVMIVNYIFGG